MKMSQFWDVLVGIKYASEKAGVQIVTGDTKVVERGKGDKIFVNTTGIGSLHPKADIRSGRVKIGDKIIISGNIATHGIAILSVRRGLEFETDIESDTCNLNHTVLKLIDEFESSVHLMRDPTRGGVASSLNEISRDTGLGFDIWEKELPIDGQVLGACEIMGLDPLYVANEGVFIAIVDGNVAEAYVERLKGLEYGSNASIIGEVVDDHHGKVLIETEMGGRRVVHMQVGEQLPRIC
jgi:hydrogenase expression/formation protein HypE